MYAFSSSLLSSLHPARKRSLLSKCFFPEYQNGYSGVGLGDKSFDISKYFSLARGIIQGMPSVRLHDQIQAPFLMLANADGAIWKLLMMSL
jgi:hypothetical protein